MAEYLVINDVHLSDRPPSSCTDSYLDDLFGLLGETVRIADERHAAAVVYAGDVFHHKTPGRSTHGTVRRLIDLARSYPCPAYVVPGNHDMSNDRFDSLDETQPLGVVIASGAFRLLSGWMAPDVLDDGSYFEYPVYGVPWLPRFDDDLVEAALDDFRTLRADGRHHLVVTHAPLYPPGQELKYENYPTAKWADAMGNDDAVAYGHVHEPHGIYTSGGATFANPGALSRGSLHEHNLKRGIQILSWQSDTGRFELVPLPHKPASEVFRLKEIGKATTAQLKLDEFLQSVGDTRLEITSIEAVMAHVDTLGLSTDEKNVIRLLLEEAS